MADAIPGWASSVHQGLTEPPLMVGVPLVFCVLNVLVALGIALVWWPWLLVGAGLHGVARLGTALDMQWGEVLVQHVSYAFYYES